MLIAPATNDVLVYVKEVILIPTCVIFEYKRSSAHHLDFQIICRSKLKLKIVLNFQLYQSLWWSQEIYVHLLALHFVSTLSWLMFHIFSTKCHSAKGKRLSSNPLSRLVWTSFAHFALKFIKRIKDRQKALRMGNMIEFRRLRNQVNRERKCYWSKFYFGDVSRYKV